MHYFLNNILNAVADLYYRKLSWAASDNTGVNDDVRDRDKADFQFLLGKDVNNNNKNNNSDTLTTSTTLSSFSEEVKETNRNAKDHPLLHDRNIKNRSGETRSRNGKVIMQNFISFVYAV